MCVYECTTLNCVCKISNVESNVCCYFSEQIVYTNCISVVNQVYCRISRTKIIPFENGLSLWLLGKRPWNILSDWECCIWLRQEYGERLYIHTSTDTLAAFEHSKMTKKRTRLLQFTVFGANIRPFRQQHLCDWFIPIGSGLMKWWHVIRSFPVYWSSSVTDNAIDECISVWVSSV